MRLMREIDPQGVDLRRSRRLCRRVYYNKVCVGCGHQMMLLPFFRALISSGTSTDMISCHTSIYAYMVVLMG